MSEELKPCPMCGGGAAFKEDGEGGHYIECQNKLCAITTNLRYACGEDPKPLLAEVWNRRAQPEPASPAEQDWSEPELWAEIYRLRAAVKGPDGFDSWQDAATDERIRRVRAERALAAPSVAPEPVAWRWKYKFRDIGETGAYEYHSHDFAVVAHLPKGEPLFTHPPRAPLTDADVDDLSREMVKGGKSVNWLCRAIESAHGISAAAIGEKP